MAYRDGTIHSMTEPTTPPNYQWLQDDALTVAPRLLGWSLVHHTPAGPLGGRIIETEAYAGTRDPASHAYRGRTRRTAPLFEAGGALYLYFSYGMHTCLNLVAGPAGEAQAVLIRALEPTLGQTQMQSHRPGRPAGQLANGPAKLTQALGLTLDWSGHRLGQEKAPGEWLELQPPSVPVPPATIASGPRIGIKQAADRPWRFWVAEHPGVSRAASPRLITHGPA